MIGARALQSAAIGDALAACSPHVEQSARSSWLVPISGSADALVDARVDDGWLLLDTRLAPPPVAPHASHPWELLGHNAALAGGAKFVIAPHDTCLHLRAELPLGEDLDIHATLCAALAGFGHAQELFAGTQMPQRGEAVALGAGGQVSDCSELAQRCGESEWPFIERPNGEFAVELDVPGLFQQAIVSHLSPGNVHASVNLIEERPAAPSPLCRDAVAVLLLRIGGLVRMARTAVADGAPCVEVILGTAASPLDLTHAFAALSIACRLSAREVEVLWRDEAVARAYLEQSPWSLVPGP